MNTELIGQMWDNLASQHIEFIDTFYQRLFQQYPKYQQLFSESLPKEMEKMLTTVALMARVSGDSETAHSKLVKIGEQHNPFQLQREDLENFKTLYLQVLKEYARDSWTDECAQTWTDVFEDSIIPFMTEGLRSIKPHNQKLWNLKKVTSMRNQLLGTVTRIKPQMYHGEVTLKLKGGEAILAILTLDSIKQLGLTEGREAYIFIRASHLILLKANSKLKISMANCLCGKVIECNYSRLNAEIVLELTGGDTLKVSVPHTAVSELDIKVGERLFSVFKATNVVLAVEE